MAMRNPRTESGQGLVEFAVIFPLLVFFLFAVFQVGLGLNRQATLQAAAREGARYGAVIDDISQIQQTTSNQSHGLVPASDVVVCYEDIDANGVGPGDAVNVSLSYTFKPQFLRSALSLFGSSIADIPIDVKGSSRLERTLADPAGAPVC